ncbi:MAG: VCBS repeat-containing protein, partial [Planctomycetes bacterium]|nr:VCBS repeat-containing protein [Planctomycetota bacterium]
LAGRAPDGTGRLRLRHNRGRGRWSDASGATGLADLAGPAPRSLVPADFDGDGDTDLLVVTATEGLRVIRNDGGHAKGQLKVRLRTLKTNPSGLGARVEVRAGTHRVTRAVSRIPLEIGLNGRSRLDSIQTVWTNGVVDNQIDVAVPAGPLTVEEKNVAAGSCPFLYAWDGTTYRFVTDILGNAPLGLSLRRDVILPADPDEIVHVGDAAALPPVAGRFRLAITDEYRELFYLDEVHLLAVDHPPSVEIHPTDRLGPPPFPPSELRAVRLAATLVRAVGSDGVDRTEALRAVDGVFAEPGHPLPPPYRGQTRPLAITLDFGPLDPAAPLVLAATGWLQYGDASTNIAISQDRSLAIVPPTLEAETADGAWAPVDVVLGMPAGKTKTILADLAGRLPADTRRLRLTTSFEIRWDRIALAQRVPDTLVTVREIPPCTADLRWRGFTEIFARAPGHPTTPDWEVVDHQPPWRTTPQGWCTRYGDVLPLVTGRDGALAILNGGDAVLLEFRADGLPALGPSSRRSFFLHSVGWDKDEDHNVVDGDTVEPMPREGSPSGDDDAAWRLQYNTRWVPHDRFHPDRPR